MPVSHIPDGVRRFLLAAIPTVPHLEALLLLHAAPRERWDIAALARRLYVDPATTARLIDDLAAHDLVDVDAATCRFSPVSPALADVVDQLAGVYARHVVEVAELIHSSSDRKARQFADAFRLRKEP